MITKEKCTHTMRNFRDHGSSAISGLVPAKLKITTGTFAELSDAPDAPLRASPGSRPMLGFAVIAKQRTGPG
jgi:hypothetical protein